MFSYKYLLARSSSRFLDCFSFLEKELIFNIVLVIHICIVNRSLYRHAPNWFPTPLVLQDTGTQHTTWRYSDLLAVLYFCRATNYRLRLFTLFTRCGMEVRMYKHAIGHLKILSTPTIYTEIDNLPEG